MEFKIIKKEQIEKLYPCIYDKNILKSYSLMNWKLNTTFQYYYSCYHSLLDDFLKKELHLNELNEQIKEINRSVTAFNLYHEISSLNLEYVFIRNNIFLERLTKEEFSSFQENYKNDNREELEQLVKSTYQKLIVFDINKKKDYIVNYDLNGSLVTYNNALVIGILAKNTNDLQKLIKGKEMEYAQILHIPVSIFVYQETESLDEKIEIIKNLNIEKEQEQKNILKKYPKYLPLGSVITLKYGWKKLMIMGYSPIDMNKKDKIYDYLGCFYPEGVITTQINILFNHEDIKSIHSIGLIDEEQKHFMDDIKDLIGNEEEQKKILKIVNEQK